MHLYSRGMVVFTLCFFLTPENNTSLAAVLTSKIGQHRHAFTLS